MDKKKLVRFLFWFINIIVIVLLVWSLVNYNAINQEISGIVKIWGLIAMIFFVILLEGAPLFIGPSVAVVPILLLGTINPWQVLLIFLASAFIGNALYYALGYFYGKSVLKYFDEEDVERYDEFVKTRDEKTVAFIAISPIPCLPTLAGIFKLKSAKTILNILSIRLARHVVVFIFWILLLKIV